MLGPAPCLTPPLRQHICRYLQAEADRKERPDFREGWRGAFKMVRGGDGGGGLECVCVGGGFLWVRKNPDLGGLGGGGSGRGCVVGVSQGWEGILGVLGVFEGGGSWGRYPFNDTPPIPNRTLHGKTTTATAGPSCCRWGDWGDTGWGGGDGVGEGRGVVYGWLWGVRGSSGVLIWRWGGWGGSGIF